MCLNNILLYTYVINASVELLKKQSSTQIIRTTQLKEKQGIVTSIAGRSVENYLNCIK